MFECEEPVGFPGGTCLMFTIHEPFKSDEKNTGIDEDSKLGCHMIGCLRLSATTNATLSRMDALMPAQRELVTTPANQRSPEQAQELFNLFRESEPDLAAVNTQIANAWTNWPYP